MAESRLNVLVGAKIQGLQRGLKSAKRSLRKFERSTAAMGQTLTRSLTAPMLGFAAVSIKAFDVQAKAEAGLLTALGQNEAAFKSLTDQAKELQKITLFGDEETIAAQTMLATMGLEEEAIKRLIPLVQDMATAKGMNLKAAADLVAKSVGSSTNALSRYGITIEGAVGSTERLDSAVGSLSTMFSGQAKASAEAGAGAWVQMKNEMMDFAEVVGESLMPMIDPLKEKLQRMTDSLSKMTSEQITAKIKTGLLVAAIGPLLLVLSKLASGFQVILGVIPKVISGLRLLSIAIASNPIGAIATALALVIGYMVTFGSSTNKAKNDLDNFNKTGSTTAERIKEINDQLDRSTKSEFELIKEEAAAKQKAIFEEMGNLSHLATDRLAELQKEYDTWGDVIVNVTEKQAAQITKQNEWNESINTSTEATKELGENMALIPSYAQQWGIDFESLGEKVSVLSEVTSQFVNSFADGFVNLFGKVEDAEGNIVSFGEKFKGFATSIIGDLIKMIAKAVVFAAIMTVITGGSFTAAASVGGSFLDTFGSNLTGMATGGNVLSGQPYLVGEHGPELFTPSGSSGGQISSASQTAQMGTPDVRISGEDLIIVFDRANKHRNTLG